MLFFVLKKMTKNFWLTICLLSGFILAVAIVCCIPMYAKSAPLRKLNEDFVHYQRETGRYPAYWSVDKVLSRGDAADIQNSYLSHENKLRKLVQEIDLPLLGSSDTVRVEKLIPNGFNRNMDLIAYRDLEERVILKHGRMYSDQKNGSVYEAVITENDMLLNKLVPGKIYKTTVTCQDQSSRVLEFEIVGVIGSSEANLSFNYERNSFESLNNGIFINFDLFKNEIIEGDILLDSLLVYSYYTYDYRSIDQENIDRILEALNNWGSPAYGGGIQSPIKGLLEECLAQEETLRYTMLAFSIPILLVILVLVYMISSLIVDSDANELAVIASRGGSRLQIVSSYFVQGLLLCLAALIAGPPGGILLCRILGTTTSFMEFSREYDIPVVLDGEVYLYALAAAGVYLLTMLLTSVYYSGTSIIQYKQKKSKRSIFFVLICLAACIMLVALPLYWRINYTGMAADSPEGLALMRLGTSADPMLFINAVLFSAGVALGVLIVYPLAVKLLFYAGKRIWTPSMYLALVQTGRTKDMKLLFMMFIMLAFSIGIFSSNTARTVTGNAEDNIRYLGGADAVLAESWDFTDPDKPTESDRMAAANGDKKAADKIEAYNYRELADKLRPVYEEPDFNRFTGLNGVKNAARVFRADNGTIRLTENNGSSQRLSYWRRANPDENVYNVSVYGINTREFGETAWFRNDLLPDHWYSYLNMLGGKSDGVLLSGAFSEKYGIRQGDRITLEIDDQSSLRVEVAGFVDYWPGFETGSDEDSRSKELAVVNLDYLQAMLPLQPYQVWIKKEAGLTAEELVNGLGSDTAAKIDILFDVEQELTAMKREPGIQGINGSLTMSFLFILFVSVTGFLIYWILSIRKRRLLFGFLRSAGLPFGSIIRMLLFEQILTSIASILSGVLVGQLATRLFLPVMRFSYYEGGQVLPFLISFFREDYLRLYAVCFILIAIAMLILARMVAAIRISQAIKLGED